MQVSTFDVVIYMLLVSGFITIKDRVRSRLDRARGIVTPSPWIRGATEASVPTIAIGIGWSGAALSNLNVGYWSFEPRVN